MIYMYLEELILSSSCKANEKEHLSDRGTINDLLVPIVPNMYYILW